MNERIVLLNDRFVKQLIAFRKEQAVADSTGEPRREEQICAKERTCGYAETERNSDSNHETVMEPIIES